MNTDACSPSRSTQRETVTRFAKITCVHLLEGCLDLIVFTTLLFSSLQLIRLFIIEPKRLFIVCPTVCVWTFMDIYLLFLNSKLHMSPRIERLF